MAAADAGKIALGGRKPALYTSNILKIVGATFDPAERMARVYFDGIASSITRDDLWEFFTRAGEVRGVLLVTDKVSGESRRFGCVDMATDADALHAMDSLKDSSIKGGRIRIDQAKPAKPAHKISPMKRKFEGS